MRLAVIVGTTRNNRQTVKQAKWVANAAAELSDTEVELMDWQMLRKPSAIVSHGTVGGARAAMHLKEILSEARGVPISNFVALAHMSDVIDEAGNLSEEEKANPYGPQGTLEAMLAELKWYSDALAAART